MGDVRVVAGRLQEHRKQLAEHRDFFTSKLAEMQIAYHFATK